MKLVPKSRHGNEIFNVLLLSYMTFWETMLDFKTTMKKTGAWKY